ncbi:dual specificity protein phosphatase family protein [Infirmifilum lucidum]|uniref:Dual specificity protein phosphatase family protein n=1 Tax=Infirmifilum lucidum TaxID=2776706 RepID=A0A7L9FGY0_9CREN|nr:dual specificity protein phosphatase family protein [Infirmifilum lucidum]QOJ78572.1 dual specificity protein phosphatase family protein [Infirmifilum lucidum]
MSRFRVLRPRVYWSSCPSTEDLKALLKQGLSLVVDLTEDECYYQVPEGVRKLAFPIPDFSFRSPELVFHSVIEPVKEEVEGGGSVLLHCMGGIGRSGTLAAMLLVALDGLTLEGALSRVKKLGGGPQVPAQFVSLKWFERNLAALGYSKYLFFSGLLSKLNWPDADRISSRVNLALDIFTELGIAKGSRTFEELFECLLKSLTPGSFWASSRRLCELMDSSGAISEVVGVAELLGNVFEGEGLYIGLENREGRVYILLNGFKTSGGLVASLRKFVESSQHLRGVLDVVEVFE